MIKMFQYMKKSAGYILLIFGLLLLQAYSDLSLPAYTSKIVDVGIQQKGIEDAVPNEIREESMDSLLLLMSEGDQKKVKDAFTLKGEMYELKKIDEETREDINGPLGEAMMIAVGMKEKEIDVSNIPKEQIAQMLPQIKEKIEQRNLIRLRNISKDPDQLCAPFRTPDVGAGCNFHGCGHQRNLLSKPCGCRIRT